MRMPSSSITWDKTIRGWICTTRRQSSRRSKKLRPSLTGGAARGADLHQIAVRVAESKRRGGDCQVMGAGAYSVGDQVELLARAVRELVEGGERGFPLQGIGLVGPDGPPPLTAEATPIDWFAF